MLSRSYCLSKQCLHITNRAIRVLSLMASSVKKRKPEDFESGPPRKKSFWSNALLDRMKDPDAIQESDDRIVIISDKFPKAEHHYLVLPLADIPGFDSLKKEDSSLLRHMDKKAREFTSKFPKVEFKYGFHAIPSMSRIHLHVISCDFNSPCLKNKKHWNSFNTEFFLDIKEVIRCLEERGKATTLTPAVAERLLKKPLCCHKCGHAPMNMPKLKEHLLDHVNEDSK